MTTTATVDQVDADDRETLTVALLRRAHRTDVEAEAARLRCRAVVVNYPLARGVARRYAGRGIETDDLQQVALLALVLAVRRFRPDRGRSFTAYAVPTMSGELKRHFRDHGWMVRPPRGLHDTYREVQRTARELQQDGVHAPRAEDIARRLDIAPKAVRAALGVEGCFSPASLDAPPRDRSDTTTGDQLTLTTPDQIDRLDTALTIRAAVRTLPARERRLVELRFEGDLTQREIGAELGISQMQVSRLLASSLRRLRAALDLDGADLAS